MTQPEQLSRQRRFVAPKPGDTLELIAERELPEMSVADAMAALQGWNLHIFLMRNPPGMLTGSDVVFVEPPVEGDGNTVFGGSARANSDA
ncbi:MAG: hypothetical protein NXH85_04470 [Pseudomonadaceae bacterium]|nr:hypothetical protein [Pseudomonadaceae bacterium]